MSSPGAPPLPPGEPPHTAQPPLPPPMGCYGAYLGYEPSVPPVSALLMREAEAWRALLQLHTGVLGAARQLAAAACEGGEGSRPMLETTREAIETREAQYYSGLTNLVAQCDALSAEALRLRTLRKTRQGADVHALEALMHAHAAETLAIGGTHAANAAVAVASVTSELRQASQATRQQIAQVRAVLQLVQDRPALRGKVQLAYGDWVLDTDKVFEAVYAESEELTDDALVRALEGLARVASADAAPSAAPPAERHRQIVRRHADGKKCVSSR